LKDRLVRLSGIMRVPIVLVTCTPWCGQPEGQATLGWRVGRQGSEGRECLLAFPRRPLPTLPRGPAGGYQPRRAPARSLARHDFLARSLFRRTVGPGDALQEPRGRGTARVERERQASGCSAGSRRGSGEPTHEATMCSGVVSAIRLGSTKCSTCPFVSSFWTHSSPAGIRIRDITSDLACSRSLMMVSRVHMPPILPPTRANIGDHWRTTKR
jgi:hypothetical protein